MGNWVRPRKGNDRWQRPRKVPERTGMIRNLLVVKVAKYCKKKRESGETALKQWQCTSETWDLIHDGKLTEEDIDLYLEN